MKLDETRTETAPGTGRKFFVVNGKLIPVAGNSTTTLSPQVVIFREKQYARLVQQRLS
jgi:hypothetical protein